MRSSLFLQLIPATLIVSRAILGPLVLIAVWGGASAYVLLALLLAGFISDIFDGVIARRLHIATENLRRADSLADTLFFACMLATAWIRYPHILNSWWPAIATIATLEVLRAIYDLWKFGREASYHMWTAKLWGISLVFALGEIFLTGQARYCLIVAVIIGLFTECEGLAASLLRSEWHHDVPSIFHAWKLRKSHA
ncbi:MAG: CDP-alcohol phosphatidyltransferase family protein [Gammaproteobacteria bacterium]